ncbi:MAG: SDR family NAD(P)-dependent oxidoreductase [Actinobacteria bacterium]|nr:SDR family NAD(P)-dependent oxidoreductase [Actinomycetota bacterium]
MSAAPLAGRVALVTGSAERVGRSLALGLAAAGADVVVNHIGQAGQAEEVVGGIEALGRRASAVEADVAEPAECRRLVATALERLGRLDVLVHNASSFVQGDFLDLTEADFDRSLGVNLRGPFFLSQAAAAHMVERGDGKIIAIAGNSLFEAWPDFVSHSTAKAGLARLMQLLAVALSPQVQCLTVCPAEILPTGDPEADEGARTYAEVELRTGAPEDLVELVVYLSASTAYLNGAIIPLDGAKSVY